MQPDKQGFFTDTQQLAEEYIRERLLLLKLEAAEKSARMASIVFTSLIIGAFLIILLVLLSALGCYLLQELTGSWFYGIGIVILFYLLLLILAIVFRKSLFNKYISDVVIRIFFEKTDSNEA